MLYEESFAAMGTDVDIVIAAAEAPIEAFVSARLLFESMEARFSRFRPTSMVAQLNAGRAVDDALAAQACRMALAAFEFSGELFNPMVLPALAAAGYERSFVAGMAGGAPSGEPAPDPRECIAIDGSRVQLRRGGIDLGGIVKGWTVDLAIEQLRERYAGCLVNAGGDARCTGSEPGADGWRMAVEHPFDGSAAWEAAMTGAIATSSRHRRRWTTQSGHEAHHLIDPRTGNPSTSPLVQATVWAEEAWIAECWAKAVVIGGPTVAERCRFAGHRVLTVDGGGHVEQ